MSEVKITVTHLIKFKKKTAKSVARCFVVCSESGKRSKLDIELNMLHAIGFWSDEGSYSEISDIVVEEVWIPLTDIDHVGSLIYRQRS